MSQPTKTISFLNIFATRWISQHKIGQYIDYDIICLNIQGSKESTKLSYNFIPIYKIKYTISYRTPSLWPLTPPWPRIIWNWFAIARNKCFFKNILILWLRNLNKFKNQKKHISFDVKGSYDFISCKAEILPCFA